MICDGGTTTRGAATAIGISALAAFGVCWVGGGLMLVQPVSQTQSQIKQRMIITSPAITFQTARSVSLSCRRWQFISKAQRIRIVRQRKCQSIAIQLNQTYYSSSFQQPKHNQRVHHSRTKKKNKKHHGFPALFILSFVAIHFARSPLSVLPV